MVFARLGRSTKAGAETPATQLDQRDLLARLKRSTKAGAETPATQSTVSSILAISRVRSTKAGAETPATPRGCSATTILGCPLNEGRSRDPGDTSIELGDMAYKVSAQRRPEPRPRRHMTGDVSTWPCRTAQRRPEPRPRRHSSTHAMQSGAEMHAQRRPEPRPRRHMGEHLFLDRHPQRSTKAGAETPATLARRYEGLRLHPSLNEGRSRDPGDTHTIARWRIEAFCAQRRPEPRPRRH